MTVSTFCPKCQRGLEIPYEFDNVICPGCSTQFWIRRHQGAISLSEMWPDSADVRRSENAAAVLESRLAEVDDLIEETESDIVGLKGGEQSPALQKGCAFFGLFLTVVFVISLFMLLGRSYIGGWLFFGAILLVIFVSFARMRRKFISPTRVDELRRDRVELQGDLARLRSERERLQQLRQLLHEPKNPS